MEAQNGNITLRERIAGVNPENTSLKPKEIELFEIIRSSYLGGRGCISNATLAKELGVSRNEVKRMRKRVSKIIEILPTGF